MNDYFASLLNDAEMDSTGVMGNRETLMLWGAAIGLFVACRIMFTAVGMPAVPHVSTLLFADQPARNVIVFCLLYVVAAYAVRFIVGGIGRDAPLFCAALGMLALPTAGGDVRNALFDAGANSIFIRMSLEIMVLWFAVVAAAVLSRRRVSGDYSGEDSVTDRLAAVAAQAIGVLVLLGLIGQSPLKGQAIIGVAAAGCLATLVVHQSNRVGGSFCYICGTMLAGLVAYGWSYFNSGAILIGDTSGFFAGAARSLPLHYATAGIAGTILGYWKSQAWHDARNVNEEEPIRV